MKTQREHVIEIWRQRYNGNQWLALNPNAVPDADTEARILQKFPFREDAAEVNPARPRGERYTGYGARLDALDAEAMRARNVAGEIEAQAKMRERQPTVAEAQLEIAKEIRRQYTLMENDTNNRGRDFSGRIARAEDDIRAAEGEVAKERSEFDKSFNRETNNAWRLSRALMETDADDPLLADEHLRNRYEVAKHRLLNNADLDAAATEYREFAVELQRMRNDAQQASAISANKAVVDAANAANAANAALDSGRAIEGALQ